VERVINHTKNPVAERQRTLKTEVMGFRAGKLVRVKASSNKYRETKILGFPLYGRAYRNRLLKWSKTPPERLISA
jgi:hypothetical protein